MIKKVYKINSTINPMAKKELNERYEILMRIIVAVVSGIVLGVWKGFIQIITLINWVYALITNKRNKEIAEMCEIWNTQIYVYLKYLTMVNNQKPFPFSRLTKKISEFE